MFPDKLCNMWYVFHQQADGLQSLIVFVIVTCFTLKFCDVALVGRFHNILSVKTELSGLWTTVQGFNTLRKNTPLWLLFI